MSSSNSERDRWVYDAMVHLAKVHGDSNIEGYREWAENLAKSYYDDADDWGCLTAEEAVDEDLSYL